MRLVPMFGALPATVVMLVVMLGSSV